MKDLFGLVPPEIKARIHREEYVEQQASAGRSISEALTALDPYLDLVFIRHGAAPEILPPGAVAGRWHVRNKRGPIPSFSPITDPKGGYREPTPRILEELAERDMGRREVRDAVYQRPHRERLKEQHAKALEDEQRRDELVADLKTGWRVAGDGGLRKRKWGKK